MVASELFHAIQSTINYIFFKFKADMDEIRAEFEDKAKVKNRC